MDSSFPESSFFEKLVGLVKLRLMILNTMTALLFQISGVISVKKSTIGMVGGGL